MAGYFASAGQELFGLGWVDVALLALGALGLALVLLILMSRSNGRSSPSDRDYGYGDDDAPRAGEGPRARENDRSYDGAPCDPNEPLDTFDYSPRESRQLLGATVFVPLAVLAVLALAALAIDWCAASDGPRSTMGLPFALVRGIDWSAAQWLLYPIVFYALLLLSIDFVSVLDGDIPDWDRKERSRNAASLSSVHIATFSLGVGLAAEQLLRPTPGDKIVWLALILAVPLFMLATAYGFLALRQTAFVPYRASRKISQPFDRVFHDVMAAIAVYVLFSLLVVFFADEIWSAMRYWPVIVAINIAFFLGAVLHLNRRLGRRRGNPIATRIVDGEVVYRSTGAQVRGLVALGALIVLVGLLAMALAPRSCGARAPLITPECVLRYDDGVPLCVSQGDDAQYVCVSGAERQHCARPLDVEGCFVERDPMGRCQLVYEGCSPTCAPARGADRPRSRGVYADREATRACPPLSTPPRACALPLR